MFSKEQHPALKSEFPDIDFGSISMKIGEKWGEMSTVDREPYAQQAKEHDQKKKAKHDGQTQMQIEQFTKI